MCFTLNPCGVAILLLLFLSPFFVHVWESFTGHLSNDVWWWCPSLIFLALGSCFFYARRLRIATRWLLSLYITRSWSLLCCLIKVLAEFAQPPQATWHSVCAVTRSSLVWPHCYVCRSAVIFVLFLMSPWGCCFFTYVYNFSCDSSLAPLEGCPCNHLCLKANRRDRALLGMHCGKKKCSNKVLAQCTMMFTCPHSKEVFMTVHESRPERSICSLRMCLWVLPVRFMFVFYIFVLTWYPLVTLYTMKYRASPSPKGQPLFQRNTCSNIAAAGHCHSIGNTSSSGCVAKDMSADVRWTVGLFTNMAVLLHLDADAWVMTFRNNCVSCLQLLLLLLFLLCLVSLWYISDCEGWRLSWSLVHRAVHAHFVVHV